MNRNNLLSFARLDEGAGFRRAVYEQDPSEVGLDIFQSKGITLIVALLVSLGLWGVIWLAVASLVARVAG
jgi:hypothetical protein